MSKPIKDLMTAAYRQRFEGIDGMVVIDIRGIEANENNRLRTDLAKKQIKVTVVKNSLAARAFADSPLASITDLLDGPCAFAIGLEDTSVVNVAREILDEVKKVDNLDVKGAIMEGAVFHADEVERLSKYPTREEQLAKFMGLVLAPGANLMRAVESPGEELAGAIKGPASQIAGLLAAVKTKLENGEAIKA